MPIDAIKPLGVGDERLLGGQYGSLLKTPEDTTLRMFGVLADIRLAVVAMEGVREEVYNLTVSDGVSVTLEDSPTVSTFIDIGVSDGVSVTFEESPTISASVGVTDTITTDLQETSTFSVSLSVSDNVTTDLHETPSLSVSLSVSDDLVTDMVETVSSEATVGVRVTEEIRPSMTEGVQVSRSEVVVDSEPFVVEIKDDDIGVDITDAEITIDIDVEFPPQR